MRSGSPKLVRCNAGLNRLIGTLVLLFVVLSGAAYAQSSAYPPLRRCGCVFWGVPDCTLLRTMWGETFNLARQRPLPRPGYEICLVAGVAEQFSFCPGLVFERVRYRYTGFRCELRTTEYRKYR